MPHSKLPSILVSQHRISQSFLATYHVSTYQRFYCHLEALKCLLLQPSKFKYKTTFTIHFLFFYISKYPHHNCFRYGNATVFDEFVYFPEPKELMNYLIIAEEPYKISSIWKIKRALSFNSIFKPFTNVYLSTKPIKYSYSLSLIFVILPLVDSRIIIWYGKW